MSYCINRTVSISPFDPILVAWVGLLCALLTGCVSDSPPKTCEVVDFTIEIDGAAVPDIKKCEMFYWDRPVRKGALERYQEGLDRVEGGGVAIDESIGFEGYGYGYEVLIGAVKDNDNRIGVMTYLMKKRQQLIKEYGLDKSRPDTYAQVASNAVVMLDIRKSPIDSQRYYFKRKETDPETYAKAEAWPRLAGVNGDCSYDEMLSKMSFVLSSCARFYAFPDLQTIKIVPEYTYRMSFGSWYHSFAIAYRPSMKEATMRFYGFDGRMFAEIRHDVPSEAHGDNVLRDVRRELVRYLFSVTDCSRHDNRLITGHVRRFAGSGEWHVVADDKNENGARIPKSVMDTSPAACEALLRGNATGYVGDVEKFGEGGVVSIKSSSGVYDFSKDGKYLWLSETNCYDLAGNSVDGGTLDDSSCPVPRMKWKKNVLGHVFRRDGRFEDDIAAISSSKIEATIKRWSKENHMDELGGGGMRWSSKLTFPALTSPIVVARGWPSDIESGGVYLSLGELPADNYSDIPFRTVSVTKEDLGRLGFDWSVSERMNHFVGIVLDSYYKSIRFFDIEIDFEAGRVVFSNEAYLSLVEVGKSLGEDGIVLDDMHGMLGFLNNDYFAFVGRNGGRNREYLFIYGFREKHIVKVFRSGYLLRGGGVGTRDINVVLSADERFIAVRYNGIITVYPFRFGIDGVRRMKSSLMQ